MKIANELPSVCSLRFGSGVLLLVSSPVLRFSDTVHYFSV